MLPTFLKENASRAMSVLLLTCSLIFTSCSEDSPLNPDIEGVDGPTVTLLEDNILISLVFENLTLQGGLRYAIPEYENSYVEISPNLEGGVLMAVSVALSDIFDNAGLLQLDRQKLPGGRNLPGVPSGSLPAVAFSIPQFHNMAVYLGPEVFGVFFPVDLGIELAMPTFRFHVGEKAIGNITLVGNDENGENGGILLLMDITNSIERAANKVMRRYN